MDLKPQTVIVQFGKQELTVLRTEIQSALDSIKIKYGLSNLMLESIRFTSSSFNAKIYGKLANPETETIEKNESKFFALRHGLPENFIGCEFFLDGDNFTIIQLEIRNPKYPIIARCKSSGKTYKFTVSRIKDLLKNNRIINIT